MSGLSTKHVVLGLLIERPGYGYDLQQRMKSRLGFLGLSVNAIYSILDRLEDDGSIENIGEKPAGRTRRGAARVMYRITQQGRDQFREWMAAPSERVALRDEMRAKLIVADPADLPDLLKVAELQAHECVIELAGLQRPVLATVAEPDVPWSHAAVMMADDLQIRLLQALSEWLEAICDLIEERIARSARPAQQRD